MNSAFFVDQQTMETLISQGKTRLEGTSLTIEDTGDSYKLIPAVKVLSCESSTRDPLRISDKYIPIAILESSGIEIHLDSIIVDNHSYHIDPGYICNRAEISRTDS